MIIKKITTIASVAALAVSATTLGAIKANASPYERALLASGASELEAVALSRPRTSGAPITRRTLEIRQDNIKTIKENGTGLDYLAEVEIARAANLPIPSAYNFIALPVEHPRVGAVYDAVFNDPTDIIDDPGKSRGYVNALLTGGVAEDDIDLALVQEYDAADDANGEQVALRAHIAAGADRLAAYNAIVGDRVPTNAEIIAWVAADDANGEQVALRARIAAGADDLAAYDAIVANRVPTDAEVQAWVDASNANGEQVALRAHIAAGADRLAAYNAIVGDRIPTDAEINDYAGLNGGTPDELRDRALIVMDLARNAPNRAAYGHFVTVVDGAIDAAKIQAVVGIPQAGRRLAGSLIIKNGLNIATGGLLASVKRLTDLANVGDLPNFTNHYLNAINDHAAFAGRPTKDIVAAHVNALAQAGRFDLNDAQIKAAYAHGAGLAD